MTIATSRMGTVIDNLVANLKASPSFADPVRVYDGPQTATDTTWTQAVYVGFDGDWQSTELNAVDFTHDFTYLGNTSIHEEFDVHCVAQGWTGDPTPKTSRDSALAMLAAADTVLRTDPTLGIDGSVITGIRTAGSMHYMFDAEGNVLCRIPFDVHVIATLLTT